MPRKCVVDKLLGMRLRRGERFEGIQLHQARCAQNALCQSVADLDRLVLQRGLAVARLVAKHEAEGPDIAPGDIAQYQFHLEARAAVRDLEVRLFGVDHPHIVLVGWLAVTADVRSNDGIVGHLRCGRVHGDNEQARGPCDDLVDQLLPVALHGNLRVARHREGTGKQDQNGTQHETVSG